MGNIFSVPIFRKARPFFFRNNENTRPAFRTRNPNNCIEISTGSSRSSTDRQSYNQTHSLEHGGQRKRISIAHLNAESLKNRVRFTEVKEMALEKNFDILSFSETWFNTSVSNASVHLDGYNIFRLDRLRKKGGGVCAYVKSSLKVKTLKDLTRTSDSGLQQLWLQIQHKHLKSVIVCIVYRPPDSAISCLTDELMPSYTHALSLKKSIILTGDLNCDLMSDNPRGDALRSFCVAVNATQLIKDPTRVTNSSSTLIDIVLSSDPGLVKDSGVLDMTISDHFLVYAVLDLKILKPKACYITTRSYKKYNAELFSSDVSYIPWNILDLADSLDAKVDNFNDLFLACLNDHAPIKTFKLKRKSIPFITDDIRQLIATRNNLHKIARQSGSLSDWNAFKHQRCKVKLALKKAETEYYNHQILSNKNNSASIWKTIRCALPQKVKHDLQYTKDTAVLAEEFNRFFVSVGGKASFESKKLAETYGFCTEPADSSISSTFNPSYDELFEFKPVLCSDVHKVIMDMPNNKAPGYDKVSISTIKDCLSHILPHITSIINQSLETSTFPSAWKKAEVVPHLKDGDHEVPDNNRPISLLPALSKVAEKLALQHYTSFLSDKNRLTKHQSGNKRSHSTETLSVLVIDHLFNAIDEKKVTAMVLIDLSKAFDSICHTGLLNKLQGLGTSAKALNWFQSYLIKREQTTRIGTSISSSLTVTHGVPQGSILGPVLFSLYMNDLPDTITNCSVESYVDDTKLFLSFTTNDKDGALSQIIQDLNNLTRWCCTNRLLINPQKTKLMLFGTRQLVGRLSDITIPFLGKDLSPSPSCKDLGVIFDSNLSFNDHIDYLSSSLLGKLCQINRVRHLFTKDILLGPVQTPNFS